MKYIKKYNEDIDWDWDWDWVEEEIQKIQFQIGDKVVSKGFVKYYDFNTKGKENFIYFLKNIKNIKIRYINDNIRKKFEIIDIYNNNGEILIRLKGHWPWFISDGFRKI
jgi:hypothetical protein